MITLPAYKLATATLDTSGSNSVSTLTLGPVNFSILEVGFVVTTAVTVTSAVIKVIRTKVSGTDVDIGSFTVPFTSSAIGDVNRASMVGFGDTKLSPGEFIKFTVTTTSTAGVGWCFAYGHETISAPQAAGYAFGRVAKEPTGTGSIVYCASTEL